MEPKIYLLQDCDVDGICSATIAYRYLKTLTKKPITTLFHSDKSHGITDDILSQMEDNSFIVVPDASANDINMARKLTEHNIKCLVLDHHELKVEHDGIVTINNQYGANNKALSGAGVTHKFFQYVDKQRGTNTVEQFYDLVALSIISDACSMLNYENRAYVHKGLNNISNPFFEYLCDNLITDGNVIPVNLSFKVINILNAVCRSDNQTLKEQLFKCFVGENDDFSSVLDACKREKRQQDDQVKALIEDSDVKESKNLVVMFTEDNSGKSGLLANKLQSQYLKPAFVVRETKGKYFGSCRSPINIREQLANTKLFSICNGHSAAFGVGFDIQNLDKITQYLDRLDLSECSEYKVITSIKPSELTDKLCDLHDKYQHLWTNDLPEPTIHCRVKCCGSDWQALRGATIKLQVDGISLLKFFVSAKQKESLHIGEDKEYNYDIIARPSWNEWNGNRYRQAIIDKVEVSEAHKIEFDDLW